MNAQAKTSTHASTSSSSNCEGLTGRPVPVTGITVKTKFEPEPTHGQRELGSDAFSYYSNKFNLMKTLLMKDDDVQVLPIAGITSQSQGPATTKRRKGSNAQPVQILDGVVRQTRLSFEAHPSLIIEDDIIRMLEQMNCAKISDDAEEESNDEVSDDDDEEEKIKSSVLRCLFLDDDDDDDYLLDGEDSGDQVFEDE